MSTRGVAALRAAYGAVLVLRPDAAAAALGAPVSGSHPVLRVLGLRHLVAAAALWRSASRTAGTVAAVVDGTHVASCLAWAVVRPSDRVPALRDAAAESAVLLATAAARPSAD